MTNMVTEAPGPPWLPSKLDLYTPKYKFPANVPVESYPPQSPRQMRETGAPEGEDSPDLSKPLWKTTTVRRDSDSVC
jgi:hypothetical protein